MTWTEIPPWLYQNALPDERLQEVYVRAAERKVEQLCEERRALADELRQADEQLVEARAFLAMTRDALARYRRRRRGP